MARETAIDMKRLWELTHEGKSVQEIMQELNLSDIDAVNNALEQLMQDKGILENGGRVTGETSIKTSYMHDGIRLTPAMLTGKGFKPGDRFSLKVENNRIILEKE